MYVYIYINIYIYNYYYYYYYFRMFLLILEMKLFFWMDRNLMFKVNFFCRFEKYARSKYSEEKPVQKKLFLQGISTALGSVKTIEIRIFFIFE